MQATRINWPWKPLYTWNPITGCKRGCPWCYARRIHQRFHPDIPFSEIVVHEDRLEDLMPRKPSYIFVGSMTDLEYWPDYAVREILQACRYHVEHTFLFLSKNPMSYYGVTWPPNTMQGVTITCHGDDMELQYRVMLGIRSAPRPFLSIEPLLGVLRIKVRDMQVIVGKMTGPGAVAPRREWVQSIKDNVPAKNIYWKQPELEHL